MLHSLFKEVVSEPDVAADWMANYYSKYINTWQIEEINIK